jgi:hypothetical protein
MVRLLIPLVAIILIWLLFFSSFSKRIRIGASIILISLTVLGLWLDTNGRSINTSRVTPAEVESCGVSGSFSYRSNYNLKLCLKNNAASATVHRLSVQVDALACSNGECEVQDSVDEVINLRIEAGEQIEHIENLSFPKLPEVIDEPVFTIQVLRVWASR